MTETVLVTCEDAIATVVLNRPEKLNALTKTMWNRLGDVIGDLNRRRGRVLGLEARAGFPVATVHVPLSEMFGYSTVLRESEDGSAGLLDAELRTVAVSKKLPLHFGSFAAAAEHLPRYYKTEELEEGAVAAPHKGVLQHLEVGH